MQISKPYRQARNLLKYMKYNASYVRDQHYIVARPTSIPDTENRLGRPGVFQYCTAAQQQVLVSSATFEKVCEETLESLTEYFDKIVEDSDNLKLADVSYSSGVLTVFLGEDKGTYVINRQSPNKQIWLSSPISGPKRYDFMVKDNCWIYKHDGISLHRLLQDEISKMLNNRMDFSICSYSKL